MQLKALEKIKLSKESTGIVATLTANSVKALEKIRLSKRLNEITALLSDSLGTSSGTEKNTPSIDLSPFELIVQNNEITLDTLSRAIDSTKQILDTDGDVPPVLLQAAEVVAEKIESESFFDSMNDQEKSDFLKMTNGLTDLISSQAIAINDVLAQTADTSDLSFEDPTQADLIANDYQTAKFKVNGLDICIENPIGTIRSGVSENGVKWETEMKAHYGYIDNTVGADGDEVDVFVLPNVDPAYQGTYFVIFQNDHHGNFDEHKIIIGAPSRTIAAQIYREHFDENWTGMGQIVEYSYEELLEFLESLKHSENHQTQAFYDSWSSDGTYEFLPISKIVTENAPDLKEAKISREDPIVVFEVNGQFYLLHGKERLQLAEKRKERMIPSIIMHDDEGMNWATIKKVIRRFGQSPIDPEALAALLEDEVFDILPDLKDGDSYC